jgi:hypothetical protein
MKTLSSLFPVVSPVALSIAVAVVTIAAASVSPLAHAVLGGAPGSPAQASSSGAVVRAQGDAAQPSFTVSESVLAGGTTVHEYVSPNGVVFAVTWSGPQIPDLRALLGARFDSYVGALAQQRATSGMHGVASVGSNDMVVQSAGHMGAFAGLAYLPAQLPPGVTPTDLH